MEREKIIELLERWMICQHCIQKEYDYDHIMCLGIEQVLLREAGLDMENNWEDILIQYGLIQHES